MHLAKPALDVGLFTNHPEQLLPFWQDEIGIVYDETLPVGGGVHQLRHRLGESIIKINHSRSPLEEAPRCGYQTLVVATPDSPTPLLKTDPEGNAVAVVPIGHEDIEQLQLEVAVRDVDAHADFYGRILGLEPVAHQRFRCGASLLALRHDPTVANDVPMRGQGYRYITLQVFDVVAEHARILERGGREGSAPRRLGEVAYISFVRDPDGNWIEISQRKSLTGSLD